MQENGAKISSENFKIIDVQKLLQKLASKLAQDTGSNPGWFFAITSFQLCTKFLHTFFVYLLGGLTIPGFQNCQ